MARPRSRFADETAELNGRPRRNRREVTDQMRQWYGELSDEDLDLLEYEEEFDEFEPILQKRRGRPH